MSIKLLAIALLVIVAIAIAAALCIYAYNKGYSIGFEKGREKGEYDGYQTGYAKGYDAGYAIGNKSGYESGYSLGYNVGHKEGFEAGNATGFMEGKAQGIEQGSEQGYKKGYDEGYSVGYSAGLNDSMPHKYTLRDPTYSEAIAFIGWDETNLKKYIPENFEYVCIDFAIDVCKNAQARNLRCHVVELVFKNAIGAHMIVGFNTIDRGWIFIEPQNDKEVKVGKGIRYYRDNDYELPEGVTDDTIIKINIIP
jgi:hypothetical protein